MPLTIALPTDDPTERTTDLIAASATVWRLDGRGVLVRWRGAGCCR